MGFTVVSLGLKVFPIECCCMLETSLATDFSLNLVQSIFLPVVGRKFYNDTYIMLSLFYGIDTVLVWNGGEFKFTRQCRCYRI